MIASSESWPTGPSSKRRSWTSVSSATAWHTSASWGWEAVYNISEHCGKPPSWGWWKTLTFGQCFLRSKPLEVINLQVQGSSIPFGVKALRDDHEHQSHQLQLDIVLIAKTERQYKLYNISKHCGKQPSWCWWKDSGLHCYYKSKP